MPANKYTYQIIRSRRRSLALQIDRNGELLIRAPHKFPEEKIDKFFKSKINWVDKHITKIKEATSNKKSFHENESFLFLGEIYKLKYDKNINSLTLEEEFILNPLHKERAKEHFVSWYKERALEVFRDRSLFFENRSGLISKDIKISKAKYQWGSCSPDNIIRLNWRLVMAPLKVIDYVICHELAHIKYKSHGPRFWKLVEKIYPNFKEAKKWLRDNSHLLAI